MREAQLGDRAALEQLLEALRGPMQRFALRMGPTLDHEVAAQEALLDITKGIAGYRWEASFLSWCYRICARSVARHARSDAKRTADIGQLLEASVAGQQEEYTDGEAILLEQSVHLSCAIVVSTSLSVNLRRAYLFGEVLGVDQVVGSQICGCAEDAFRQRVSRARKIVQTRIRAQLESVPSDAPEFESLAEELDSLVRIGELVRVRRPTIGQINALRAAEVLAPQLLELSGGGQAEAVQPQTVSAN